MTNLKIVGRLLTATIIGFATGAFIGGLPLGKGLSGAMLGGVIGAAGLAILSQLLTFKKWIKAEEMAIYASAGFLPGMLIGGGKMLGLGVVGAVIFGVVSSVFYAAWIYNMIKRHEKTSDTFVILGMTLRFFIRIDLCVFCHFSR